jgi:hypothetical protein
MLRSYLSSPSLSLKPLIYAISGGTKHWRYVMDSTPCKNFLPNLNCESTFVKEIDVLPIIELACIVGNSRILSVPSF